MSTLWGNDFQDDTENIQDLLDRGGEAYLPGGDYLISHTLKIGDNTHFRMAQDAVIHLADGAHCVMLENEGLHIRRRNRRISISGGVWDGNNAHQSRDKPGSLYDDLLYFGFGLRFAGVEELDLSRLTVKDPESYAMQLCDVERFTVEHITFDFNLLRPNMDGVHVQGPARFGRIADIKGATNDDMVALNCDDGPHTEFARGNISDVEVDGLFAECGYTAVRLLSCGHTLQNVSIGNIFGTFRFYAVSFTHHDVHPGEPVLMENVTLRNVFASKPIRLPDEKHTFFYPPSHAYYADTEPLIWFAPGVVAENITIADVHRTENAMTHAVTVLVDHDARVSGLVLRDITQRFTASQPQPTVKILGKVDGLVRENVQEL